MALLNITVISASSDPIPGAKVVCEVTDVRGVPVPGFTASGQVFVDASVETTDASGLVSINLVPNDEITPLGTYYTVRIGAAQFLVTKTDATQTLAEAIVEAP